MGAIRLYGDTSGYLELQAPAVAPDSVLTLPSTGFGKILQVVRATDSTARSTTSTSFVDANISVTITPNYSDSAIILWWIAQADRGAANGSAIFQLTDATNNALSGAESMQIYENSSGLLRVPINIVGYATPATTSATTYKSRFRSESASVNTTLQNASTTGQLFAIEVSA